MRLLLSEETYSDFVKRVNLNVRSELINELTESKQL